MKNRGKFLKTSLLNLIKALGNWVLRNQLFIFITFTTIVTVLMFFMQMPLWIKVATVVAMNIVDMFSLAMFLEYKNVELKDKLVFPRFSKRYTHVIGNDVFVKQEEWQEAIIFLNQIEDYLENVGVYNKGE